MAKELIKPQYVKTAKEILALGVTQTPMLVENLLQQKGMACLTGSSDGGKSFLGLFLASILCGDKDKIFERKINRNTGGVIVVCTEDSAEDICVRLTKFSTHHKIDEEKLGFIFETSNLPSKLKTVLEWKPADLIIMDTFGDLFPGNLNDSIAVRKFLTPYKELANDFNCLFLFNHHIGKGKEGNATPSKNDVLGSQGIESACRTVLMLRKKEDGKRILTVVKGNHISEEHKNKGIVLTFDVESGFEATGDTVKYSEHTQVSNLTKPMIEEVLILYPLLKSCKKVADAMKLKGYKKVDKNKVAKIWKEYGPSVPPPTENDGRTEEPDSPEGE
ncbi:MAG TPA: AAA family ATPase [Ferruginibacter sp.]|nr:AAA family ATPase [Ferruginibacter sp.]